VEKIEKHIEKCKKQLIHNGGFCIRCKTNKAEIHNPNSISNFHCKICNSETQQILEILNKKII